MAETKRVRMQAGDRRAQLVETATALIARNGYRAFSIAALASATGLTRPGVLHHVGSKEALLLDVLALRDQYDIEEATGAAGERSEVDVRAVLDGVVRRNLAQPEIVRLYSVLAAEALDPEHPAHQYFLDRQRAGVEALAANLDGFDRPAGEVAAEIYAFMDGLQLNWLRDPSMEAWEMWSVFADRLFGERMSARG